MSEPLSDHSPRLPAREALPNIADLAPRLRRDALQTTLQALRADWRPGLTALVADGGDRAARQALADAIAAEVHASVLDATSDPSLAMAEATPTAGQTLVILDGDVAPRLQECIAVRREAHGVTIIVIPGGTIRAIGEPLGADLVLGVPGGGRGSARATPLATEVTLPEALDLVTSELPAPNLPEQEELFAALWRFVAAATHRGDAGAREIIGVCQRLGAGPDRPIVRRVLAGRAQSLLDHLPTTSPHAALTWARLFRDFGISDAARQVLISAMQSFPGDIRLRHAELALRLQGVPPSPSELGAMAELLHATRRNPDTRYGASHLAHTLARAQRRSGDLAAARATIETALLDDSDNEVLLIEAGLIAAYQEDWVAAEQWFRTARRLAPRSGVALNAWGRAAAMAGDPERAALLLARAHNVEPWNARHLLELAHLAKSRGLLREAEPILLDLLDDPEPATMRRARVELADLLIEAGPERWEDAEAVCDDLDTLDDAPGVDDLARQTGLRMKLLIARGQPGTAEALAKHVGMRGRASILAAEVTAILAQGDPHRAPMALQLLEDVRALPAWRADPATRRVRAALSARASLLLGRVEEARRLLDDELEISPALPILLNARARIELEEARRLEPPGAAERASDVRLLLQRSLAGDPRNAYTRRELASTLAADDPARAEHLRYVLAAGLSPDTSEESLALI